MCTNKTNGKILTGFTDYLGAVGLEEERVVTKDCGRKRQQIKGV